MGSQGKLLAGVALGVGVVVAGFAMRGRSTAASVARDGALGGATGGIRSSASGRGERSGEGARVGARVDDASPAPLAPTYYTLEAGLFAKGEPGCDVEVATGRVTIFETDLAAAPGDAALAIRRAITAGDARRGTFGLGWRFELGAQVRKDGDDLVVERLQGATRFVHATDGIHVSTTGDVEFLHAKASGFELTSACGRTFRFDASGKLVALEKDGRTITVERTTDSLVARDGKATLVLSLDRDGRVTRATLGSEWVAYSYSPAGELVRVSGFRERRYRTAGRRVVQIDDARETLVGISYDETGRVAELREGSSVVRTFTYEKGRTTVATPAGTQTYEHAGRELRFAKPGRLEHVRFDERGRMVERTVNGGAREAWFHDELGRLVAIETDGVRRALRWENGRCTGIEDDRPDAAIAEVAPRGGARGHEGTGEVTRDRDGRVAKVTTPGGREWTFEHANGTVASVAGPWGKVALEHDAQGRLTGRRDESGRAVAFEHDASGRLVRARAATGEEVTFEHDERGRLVAKDSGEHRVERTLDASGRVVRVDADDHVTSYEHGPRGLSSIATPFGTTTFARGDDGNVIALDGPAGRFAFERDDRGLAIGTRYPNGVHVRVARDDRGRATRIDSSVLEVEIGRGSSGVRTFTRVDGRSEEVAFDAAGRVLKVGGTRFGWDADGNLVEESTAERTIVREHDARGRLVRVGGDRIEYDRAGRIVARHRSFGVDRFSYDGFGRLVRVERAGRAAVSFDYDADGHVATRTVAGRETRYVYEGPRRVAEIGPRGMRVFVHGLGLDESLAYREGATWTFLHADELGTVRAYSDAEGKRVAIASVDAFGLVTSQPGERPVFFAGRPFDAEAGLYDFRARFYDPELRIFLTPDPSGLQGGVNAYAYCEGNPIELKDPTGLQAEEAEEPGLLDRIGAWLETKKRNTRANWEGIKVAAEAIPLLLGNADADAVEAAREASFEDFATKKSTNRAAGALDGFIDAQLENVDGIVQLVTLGYCDPALRERLDPILLRSFDSVDASDAYWKGRYGGELASNTADVIVLVRGAPELGRGVGAAWRFVGTKGIGGTLGAGVGALRGVASWGGAKSVASAIAKTGREAIADGLSSFGTAERVAPKVLDRIAGVQRSTRAAAANSLGVARALEEGNVASDAGRVGRAVERESAVTGEAASARQAEGAVAKQEGFANRPLGEEPVQNAPRLLPEEPSAAYAETLLRSSDDVTVSGYGKAGHPGTHVPLDGADAAKLVTANPQKPLNTAYRNLEHAKKDLRDFLKAFRDEIEALPDGKALSVEWTIPKYRPGHSSAYGSAAREIGFKKVFVKIIRDNGRVHVQTFVPLVD